MRAFLIAIVLGLLAPASFADTWTKFRVPAGSFTVDVPEQMIASTGSTKDANGEDTPYNQYAIDYGAVALLILDADFSTKVYDPVTGPDQAFASAAANGRTLVSKTRANIDGHDVRTGVFTDPRGLRFVDRLFFENGHLVQLIAVTSPGSPDDKVAAADRFTNSLHFDH